MSTTVVMAKLAEGLGAGRSKRQILGCVVAAVAMAIVRGVEVMVVESFAVEWVADCLAVGRVVEGLVAVDLRVMLEEVVALGWVVAMVVVAMVVGKVVVGVDAALVAAD